MVKRKTRSLNIPAKYPDRADRMILGDGCIFSTDCRKTGLNNNILVVGGSGSGKTVSIVEPFLLESFSRSIVCSVTKRGIVNKFIPLLQNRGIRFWILILSIHRVEMSALIRWTISTALPIFRSCPRASYPEQEETIIRTPIGMNRQLPFSTL